MQTYLKRARFLGGIAALLVLSPIVLSGCGGSAKKNTMLSGKVTYKNEPVTGGSITLHPSDGKGQPFKVAIAPDGAYVFSGLTPGEMKVTVETESIRGQTGVSYNAPPGQKAPDMGVKLNKYRQIPAIYADPKTTPLRVTLDKGKQEKTFALTDSGQ